MKRKRNGGRQRKPPKGRKDKEGKEPSVMKEDSPSDKRKGGKGKKERTPVQDRLLKPEDRSVT